MVCLHPFGSFVAKSTKHGPFSLLAILPAAVTAELTLDWSYAGTWPLPDIIKTDEPNLATKEIFLQRAPPSRCGSVSLEATILPPQDNDLHLSLSRSQRQDWPPCSSGQSKPSVPK